MSSSDGSVDAVLDEAIQRRVFPAAAAEVGGSAGPLWAAARGQLTFDAEAPAAAAGTIFDLASLTKPMATTSVVLDLQARGRLHLEEPLTAFFPEWRGAERSGVTVQHLLEHASGLSARLLDRPPHGRRAFEHDICTQPLEYQPGSRAIYSDLGFILLGFCCEDRGDDSLAALSDRLLQPLLNGTEDVLASHVHVAQRLGTAPTIPLAEDERRGRRLVGEVHDNYAAQLGGFAGHAGLFGTAAGVGRFASTLLRALRGVDEGGNEPFTRSRVLHSVARSRAPGSSRALGWDTMLPTSSCGTRMSPSAFGHVGFTGTSLWIDPAQDRYFVLLTNRVCGGGSSDEMQQVRRAFHDAAVDRFTASRG